MNIQLLKLMGTALICVLPVVILILKFIDQKDKAKDNIGASLHVNKSRRHFLYRAYRFFLSIPLTRGYLDKIGRRYEVICPEDTKTIARKTMKTALISWALCTFAIFIIFLMKPNFNNGIVSLILIYVINSEVISRMVYTAEVKLLEELAVFISDIRHNYHINRMVDDAILFSMEGMSREMKVHAGKLYAIVISNNLREDVINYNTSIHNKYLKMLLSLCTGILEYSDKKVNGQFLFTANLENLKREIYIEVLKQKKLRYLFSGVTFVTIAVCVPLDAIKNFGISMMPQLESFYNGRAGIIYVTATIFTAFVIYLLNNKLKETKRQLPRDYRYLKKLEKIRFISKALDNYTEKHYGRMLKLKDTLKRIGESISPRQLLIQRLLVAAGAFLFSIIFFFYIHENNQYNLTNKVVSVETLTNTVNQKQQDMVKELVLRSVKKYKKDKVITQDQLIYKIADEKVFYNAKLNETIAKEVYRRIKSFQNEFFKWYELILCFGAAFVAFYVPYWLILYKKKVLQMNMEDEVNQFNSIIYMLMYNDHITVKDLLEELELFAVVFKQSIQECINDYNSGDVEALERMKEKEAFGPFRRLADNLIRCDTISIDKAFDEIASDRENYHDRRKQENEISVQRRADIAKPLSFIPTGLVMIYLILPILMASLKELDGFSEMMQSI